MKETRFKDTEFGKIPEDWQVTNFGDVLKTFSSGATPYRGISDYYKGKIRWISSGELNYGLITDTIEHISEEAVKNTNLKMHEPGTFLMAITGLEAAGTRGRCGIVGKPSTTNQSCLAINGTNKMLTEYLYWFYRNWGNYLAFKYCQGTKQQSYTADIVKKLPIIVPSSLSEQRRIAAALSGVDKLISCLDKKIEKKKLIKQGTMQQLLTGKVRLKGFDEEWKDVRIGDACDYISDFTAAGSFADIAANVQYINDAVGYAQLIRTVDLKSHFSKSKDFVYVNKHAYDYLWRVQLNSEALVMPNVGNCGEVYYITNKMFPHKYNVLGPNAILVKSKNEDVKFLYYYFLSTKFQEILNGIISPSGQTKYNKTALKELFINIPANIAEQRAIASVLTSMDEEIEKLEAQRDKYKQVKQGMMQQLLTGRIRLVDAERTTANERTQAI